VWVDQDDWTIVRVDRADGVRFHLGPSRSFGGMQLPAWIDVEAPGRPPVRLEVRGAAPVAAEPGDFAPAWLREPPARAAPATRREDAPPRRDDAPPPTGGRAPTAR
jgi:hypothetical protein